MKTIQIGRHTYQVKDCDYFMDNGACIQYCTGDGRYLRQKWVDRSHSLVVPKTTWNKFYRDNVWIESVDTRVHHTVTIFTLHINPTPPNK